MATQAKLEGGRYLADLFQKDSIQASLIQKLIDAINAVSDKTGTNPVGESAPPPPISHIDVKASGEMLHVALRHATTESIKRPIRYYVEVATDSNFSNTQVHDLGASRTLLTHLPTFDDNNSQQTYYVRGYAQYPGSKPTPVTVYGGKLGPTKIQMDGTTKLTLLPSTGSGTAAFNGQQGGSGMGRFPRSVKPNPKSFQSVSGPPTLQAAPTLERNTLTYNAFATTSVSQSGTSTAIIVAASTFQFADGSTINLPAGSVDPGTYGTFFVYADGPSFTNGAKYVATTNQADLYTYHWRFVVGKITTTSGGGGSGGGTGGGGGRGYL